MARFRRRRRQRVQWFPPLGTDFTIGDTTRTTGLVTFEINVLANGDLNQIELPLTFDFGTEELQAFATQNVPAITLADLQTSSWRLRRCVGKIHASFFPGSLVDNVQAGINTAPPAGVFAAGLMVRRVVGQASNTAGNVNVLEQDDYTDPWIWRRTWVLDQDGSTTGLANGLFGPILQFDHRSIGATGFAQQQAFALFPKTTSHHGSVLDGPHFDAKTNRIIGADERLFLTMTTKAMPIQPQANYAVDSRIIGVYDFRLLGGLMRTTNRRNASR